MIFLTKGEIQSILIDFEKKIIKSIHNSYIPDTIEQDNDDSIKYPHYFDKCDFDILDIELKYENNDLSKIFRRLIDKHTTFYNIKIICCENNISASFIESFIHFLNENIYHFGVLFTTNNIKLLNFVKNNFSYIKIIRLKKIKAVNKESSFFDPRFFPIYDVYKISDKNNAYHYKRMTLKIEKDNFFTINHNKYNIPKDKIQICKDCEYRRICFDERIPVKINNNEYLYEKKCSYNPSKGKWYI